MRLLGISILSFWISLAHSQIAIDVRNAPQQLTMLGTDKFSTMINERDFALSPDGKEIYYTI